MALPPHAPHTQFEVLKPGIYPPAEHSNHHLIAWLKAQPSAEYPQINFLYKRLVHQDSSSVPSLDKIEKFLLKPGSEQWAKLTEEAVGGARAFRLVLECCKAGGPGAVVREASGAAAASGAYDSDDEIIEEIGYVKVVDVRSVALPEMIVERQRESVFRRGLSLHSSGFSKFDTSSSDALPMLIQARYFTMFAVGGQTVSEVVSVGEDAKKVLPVRAQMRQLTHQVLFFLSVDERGCRTVCTANGGIHASAMRVHSLCTSSRHLYSN